MVDHRDPVGGAALDGQQHRPHVRAGGEHGPLLQLARQRHRLGQAELGAGEDRHRVAQPVASMGGQQPADSPRLGGANPDCGRNAGAVAGSEREQLADMGRQAAQLGRIQRHLHIQRQQRGSCRPHFQQLVYLRTADHDALHKSDHCGFRRGPSATWHTRRRPPLRGISEPGRCRCQRLSRATTLRESGRAPRDQRALASFSLYSPCASPRAESKVPGNRPGACYPRAAWVTSTRAA